MPTPVTFQIKIDNDLHVVTTSAEDLGRALDDVTKSSQALKEELINTASVSQILDGVSNAAQKLSSMMGSLTAAYAEDEIAAQRLAVAMRNTMDASDEEVASVEDLIREQEKLGVISGGVQTAAAQELATYLEFSDTLKTIIPVMNDMAAQQYGVGASAESVTQIASMLGKVMNGQTEALSRYGYKFDEAQKQILKYGTEAERAATLVDVITQSVGGMNAELAKTDTGRMAQLENTFEGIKAKIGSVTAKIQPMINSFSGFAEVTTNVLQLTNALKQLNFVVSISNYIKTYTSNLRQLTTATLRMITNGKVGTTAMLNLSRAFGSAQKASLALKITAGGLATVLAGALAVAIGSVIKKHKEQKEAAQEAAQEEKSIQQSIEDAVASSVGGQITKYRQLQEAWKELGDNLSGKKKFITDNAAAFEELGVSIKSIDDAEKLLISGETAFIGSLKNRAMAAAAMDIASEKYKQAVQKMMDAETYQLTDDQKAQARKQGTENASKQWDDAGKKHNRFNQEVYSNDIREESIKAAKAIMNASQEAIKAEADALRAAGDEAFALGQQYMKRYKDGMSSAGLDIVVPGASTTISSSTPSAEGLAKDLDNYKKSVQSAIDVQKAFGNEQVAIDAKLNAMKSGITSLIQKYGLENESVQDLIAKYNELNFTRQMVLPKIDSSKLFTPQSSGISIQTSEDYSTGLQAIAKDGNAASEAISSLSSIMGNLSGVVGESTASWLDWGANMLGVIGQVLPQLATLFTANTAVAAAEGGAAVASTPLVGPIMAVAAITSIIAALAKVPKPFADGGIIYGPTLGLMGEYAGASNNPEVVAPLSKLSSILASSNDGDGRVEFVIEGRTLKGILNKMNKIDGRVR